MSQVAVTTFFTDVMINLGVSSFASLHNIMLLIYHLHKIFKIFKNSEHKLHRTYLLSIISISMIVLFNISVVLLYLLRIYNSNITNCNNRVSIGIVIFFLSKVALYVLLFERCFVIFRNSQFKFSSVSIIVTRAILCLLSMLVIFPVMFEKNSEIHNGTCAANVKLYLKAAFVSIDLGISVWIMYLFSRRLWLLSLNTNNNHEESSMMSGSSQYTHTQTRPNSPPNSIESPKQKRKHIQRMNKQLLRVMTKTNLLTLIAIITTEMSMVVTSFVPGTVWPIIDSMVNCWCVLLMFKSYEKIYDYMCKYATKAISDQCLIICACPCCVKLNQSDVEIIEETITDNNGNNNKNNNDVNMLTPPQIPKTNVIQNNISLENIKAVELEAVVSITPSNDNNESPKLEIGNMNDVHFTLEPDHEEETINFDHQYQNSTQL